MLAEGVESREKRGETQFETHSTFYHDPVLLFDWYAEGVWRQL